MSKCCNPYPKLPPDVPRMASVYFGIIPDDTELTTQMIEESPYILIIHKNTQYTLLLPQIFNVSPTNTSLYRFFIAEENSEPSKKYYQLERNLSSPFLQAKMVTPDVTLSHLDDYRIYTFLPEMAQYFDGDVFGKITLSSIDPIQV